MKNLFTAFCAAILFITAMAQTPQTINYQAVARNSAGNPLLNSSVAVRISIRDGSATGTVVYAERDTATTNAFGLFAVAIGSGNVISGTFAGINWGSGDKYMQVELDPTGGSSYTDMGTSQLLSVPYALHAQSSADNHWAESGSDVYNINSGNVGIGTSTPNSAYKLEISSANSGLLKLTGSNCCTQITLDDTGADDVYLTSELGQFDVWTGGNNKRLSILPNGNVGIGTTTPSAKLEVAGNVKIADGTEGAGKVLVSDANGTASWQNIAVGTTSYTGLSHNRFYISTTTGSPYTNITTAGSSVVIIPGGAPSNGFIDGFQHNGPDEIVIYNNNATNWTIRPNQATISVPFYTGPGGANYVIAPGASVRVFYEPTTAKWWVLNGN